MSDSTLVDAALLATLNADAELVALLPHLVWFDEAPQGSTKFGVVRLEDHKDERAFEGRSHEDALYRVVAVVRTTEANAGPTMQAAAARIDVVLEGALLTVAGFDPMTCYRERRVRDTQTDVVDPAIRFMFCGGLYRVVMSNSNGG
jgi:hypothetical protein